MNNFKNLISNLSKKSKKNLYHIFLIPNQTSVIVTRLIINILGLNEEDYLLFPLRKTNISLINGKSIALNYSIINRFLIKFLRIYPLSKKVLSAINKKKRPFILYTSWAYFESLTTPSVKKIITSKLCRGHIYIEEGQLSYRKSKPYSNINKNITTTTYAMDSKYIFRDDSLGYIGILEDSFPSAPKEKKFILNNYDLLKKFYQPKIKGVKNIGLTCAERRLKNHQWESMIKKLIDNMPGGGVIKLHPSFASNQKKRKKIESILKKINSNSITICPDDVIIEIEMLYERKTLIGSLTSLNKYADVFGSKFINLDLY